MKVSKDRLHTDVNYGQKILLYQNGKEVFKINNESIRDVNMISHIPHEILTIIRQFVNDTKQLLRRHIVGEYLFGSYAINKYSSLSDIDILIIVDKLTPEMRWQMSGLASDYSLEYDICISPIIKDQQVWKSNREYDTLFYQEIMQQGIPL